MTEAARRRKKVCYKSRFVSKFTVHTVRWSEIERSGKHKARLSGRIDRDVPPGSCRQSELYGL
jgi:hypothetical protein